MYALVLRRFLVTVRAHGFPGMRCRVCPQLSCRDQKTVKFQVKIDPSTLEKTHYENITMYSMANLALANVSLGRR